MISLRVYSREVSIQPLLQSSRWLVRRWRPKDHGTGSKDARCKNRLNNVLLGKNLDAERSQVDTHTFLSLIGGNRGQARRPARVYLSVTLGQVIQLAGTSMSDAEMSVISRSRAKYPELEDEVIK